MEFREAIILAIKTVAYMFLMPLSGIMCGSFIIAIYHYFNGDQLSMLYTGSISTEILCTAICAYGFYFATTESIKINRFFRQIKK